MDIKQSPDNLWWIAFWLFCLVISSCGPDAVYITNQPECEVSE